ncbi:SusC/RagA family TonB-linked outer membrane protein [Cesiribacter andamanensis]|uniref:Outer membrane cobalamin receptor protein n=1 Tax=Cesiribacter andamanensis AMV16 TaxID=1279009 RepID=M7NLD2_9BACT|nr:TonB-dependent receptor [Cesiribacter andamanensis]EMR02600.1 Outer membrane cobalamin receptor protein [Cesiribacter andamanensis AMV16]
MQNRLLLGAQLAFSRLQDQAAPISDNPPFAGDLLAAAYGANPTLPAQPDARQDPFFVNPLALLANHYDNTTTDRHFLKLSLEYALLKNLKLGITTGLDRAQSDRGSAISPRLPYANGIYENGRAYLEEQQTSNKLLQSQLRWEKEVGKSHFTALAGYEYQEFTNRGVQVKGWGFSDAGTAAMIEQLAASAARMRQAIGVPYQQFGYSQGALFYSSLSPRPAITTLGSAPGSSVKSLAEETFGGTDELQSFFGRLQYKLQDKYYLMASLRADGSTRFAEKHRYGYFPAAALAWRLSEEAFIPDVFDELKLRLGAGITGNQQLPYRAYQSRQRFGDLFIDNGGGINPSGIITVGSDNENLKWEQTTQLNLGVDFALFEERISGSIDLYRKHTTDIFIPGFYAYGTTGFNEDWVILNKGVDLQLAYTVLATQQIGLQLGVAAGFNSNRVQHLEGAYDAGPLSGQGLSGAFVQRIVADQPLYSYYLREFNGYNEQGIALYTEDKANYLDKSALPTYTLGFSQDFRYRNWRLSALFNGQFGHYLYNATANTLFTMGALANGRNIPLSSLGTGESPLNAPDPSDRFLEKGDFMRLQHLSLAYTHRSDKTGFVKAIRFSLSGQNLLVLTGYSGLDPEVNSNKPLNGIPSRGIDHTTYPRAKTVSFGLRAFF